MKNFNTNGVFYEDEKSSIKVCFAIEGKLSKTCFVLFSPWGGRHLSGMVGGAAPLLRAGHDVVSIQTNCDDWHQNIATCAIEKLSEFIAGNYSSAKGYGSSMGGYAAILYAEKLKLDAVLALSPQYTIKEPFDTRWKAESRKIEWKYEMSEASDYKGKIFILYDPLDLDKYHAELFKLKFMNAEVSLFKLPYSSHPVTHFLNDSAILKTVLLSFAEGDFQIPRVDKRKNKTYQRKLAEALSKKSKFSSAGKLIMRVIALGDEKQSTFRLASHIFSKLGDNKVAVDFARQAVDAIDNNERSLKSNKENLAEMLRLAENYDAALDIIDSLIETDSMELSHRTVKINILIAQGELLKAKDLALESINLGDNSNLIFRLTSIIFKRLQDYENAKWFAEKAILAHDNNKHTSSYNEKHLQGIKEILSKNVSVS